MISPLAAARTSVYDVVANMIPSAANHVSTGMIILVLLYYLCYYLQHLHYLTYSLPSFQQRFWNFLVSITPASLIFALDKSREDSKSGHVRGGYRDPSAFASKSEALERILTLQGIGFLSSMQRTRSLSSLGGVFKKSSIHSLPGLGNWDNSCYQNSVLQGLASLPSVADFLAQSPVPASPEASTILALKTTVQKLNDPSHSGQTLWTPGILKSMSSWQQQDAQEYYSKILETFEKEVSSSLNSKGSLSGLSPLSAVVGDPAPASTRHFLGKIDAILPPANPLEGLLAQRVGCLQCGYVEGLSVIPFNCLTIQLGQQWSYTVEACLNEYTVLEEIHGVECPKCTLSQQKDQLQRLLHRSTKSESADHLALSDAFLEAASHRLEAVTEALEDEDFSDHTLAKKCHISRHGRVTTTKTKQIVIARAPQSLVIHVNRSRFDELTGQQSKNHARVEFPEVLDLRPWALGRDVQTEHGWCEHWNMDPSKSMCTNPERLASDCAGYGYVLRAVITHFGRHENGHYVAYRPGVDLASADDHKGPNQRWWRLSDEDVSSVTKEQVLEQGGVFMLFYEKREASPEGRMQSHEKQTKRHEEKLEEAVAPIDINLKAKGSIDSMIYHHQRLPVHLPHHTSPAPASSRSTEVLPCGEDQSLENSLKSLKSTDSTDLGFETSILGLGTAPLESRTTTTAAVRRTSLSSTPLSSLLPLPSAKTSQPASIPVSNTDRPPSSTPGPSPSAGPNSGSSLGLSSGSSSSKGSRFSSSSNPASSLAAAKENKLPLPLAPPSPSLRMRTSGIRDAQNENLTDRSTLAMVTAN